MATTPGTITSFTPTPKGTLDIGGTGYTVETAGKGYSLTQVDSQTLQFQIQAGDQAWFDGGSSVDRAEIQDQQMISTGTPVNINYQFMLQPGATNTASWFVTAEMHNYDPAAGSNVHSSPPFAIQLVGNHLQVVARYCPTGQDPSNSAGNVKMLTLWTDPNPIQPGQYNDIQIQTNVSNTSSGYLQVSINGAQVVNYHGPLGYGTPTYWEEGLYRSTTNQTITADYRALSITTGSGAVSSGGTSSGGTTGTGTSTGSSGGTTSSGGGTGTGSGASGGVTPPVTTPPGTGASGGVTPPVTKPPGTGASGGVTPPVTKPPGTGASGGVTPPVTKPPGTGASGGVTPPVTTPPGTGASGGVTPPVTKPPGTGASGGVTPPVTKPPGTGASGGVTPPVTPPKAPALSVADHSLSVGHGHSVSLGIGVTVPNKGDAVTVHVAGLSKYETITDNLDHKTFSGSSISLTAAEVNSGLTLSSHYQGHGAPTTTLTVTATDSTGKPVTSAAQTITVKDSPTGAGGCWHSSGGNHDHNHSFALLSQSLAGGSQGRADLGQIATAASHASSWLNESLLTRPHH